MPAFQNVELGNVNAAVAGPAVVCTRLVNPSLQAGPRGRQAPAESAGARARPRRKPAVFVNTSGRAPSARCTRPISGLTGPPTACSTSTGRRSQAAHGHSPVPSTLDWDLWLGPAPLRPYNPVYLPFVWRGWWDFGTGALGDIGCHSMDPVFRALKLGAPLSVQASSTRVNEETFPLGSIVTYQFPPATPRRRPTTIMSMASAAPPPGRWKCRPAN